MVNGGRAAAAAHAKCAALQPVLGGLAAREAHHQHRAHGRLAIHARALRVHVVQAKAGHQVRVVRQRRRGALQPHPQRKIRVDRLALQRLTTRQRGKGKNFYRNALAVRQPRAAKHADALLALGKGSGVQRVESFKRHGSR